MFVLYPTYLSVCLIRVRRRGEGGGLGARQGISWLYDSLDGMRVGTQFGRLEKSNGSGLSKLANAFVIIAFLFLRSSSCEIGPKRAPPIQESRTADSYDG